VYKAGKLIFKSRIHSTDMSELQHLKFKEGKGPGSKISNNKLRQSVDEGQMKSSKLFSWLVTGGMASSHARTFVRVTAKD